VLSLAAFKVVAAFDGRPRRRGCRISVESRLPLGQPGGHQHCEDYRCEEDEANTYRAGLNTSGPLDFPIEAALEASLVTTGSLSLPAEPSCCSVDLAVDSLAMLWGGCARPSQRSATSPAAAPPLVGVQPSSSGFPTGGYPTGASGGAPSACCASADLDMSADLNTDAVLLPEGVLAAAETVPRPLWPASQRLRSSSPLQRTASCSTSRYAFVFEGRRGEADLRLYEAEVLTPLDALYLARLCALDDGNQQPVLQDVATAGDDAVACSVSGCPAHLLSSDEVISALLA